MVDDDRGSEIDPALAQLARAVLDGVPVDWRAVQATAGAPEVAQLRVLSALADVHRGPAPLESGARWGPLTIIERIGRGAFGEVYRAKDPRLARDVALKILSAVAGAMDARGVIEEGRLLARVRHPNVVTVFGAEEIEGRIGIWTEFITGQTLAHTVKALGVFSAADVTAIGIDLCGALGAVHAAGLLHRDVKAQNVMQSADGRIVLMDFGASHEADERTRATIGAAGTPLYLAPELWQGTPPSIQSDIYALGVLLFHLLTGEFPVRPVSADEIANAHSAGRYRRLGDLRHALPHELVTAIERALAPAPKDRYDTAKDFASALHAASLKRGGATATASFSLLAAGLLVAVSVLLLTVRPAVEAPAETAQTARRLELLTNADFRASPDGKFILYAEGGYLWKWDVDSGRATRVTHQPLKSGPGGSYVAAVSSAHGQLIAYARRTPDGAQLLSMITADARRERTILPAARAPRPVPIEWSRDGQHVLCWLEHDDGRVDLTLVRVATGGTRAVQTFRTRPFGAVLSPDNRFVVFDQSAGPDSRKRDLFIASTTGGAPRPLAAHPATDARPFWTRDGRAVMFSSERSGVLAQWLVGVRDGVQEGEPKLVARLPPGAQPFALSDDGSLFYELLTSDIDVYLRDVDLEFGTRHGAAQRVDPEVTGGHSLPAWSPDGKLLAYLTTRTFTDEALTILDLAAGKRREVPVLLARHTPFMRWSPDRRCVAMPGVDIRNTAGFFCLSVDSGLAETLSVASAERALHQFEWTADGSSHVFFQSGHGIVARRLIDGRITPLVPPETDGLRSSGLLRLAPGDRALSFLAWRGRGEGATRSIAVQQPIGSEIRELWRAPAGESFALLGWTPNASEVIFSRFRPSQDPTKVTYRLWAVGIRDGRLRDLNLSVPGLTYAHDIAVSSTGKQIAYAHFTNRRFAEMWVMRNAIAVVN